MKLGLVNRRVPAGQNNRSGALATQQQAPDQQPWSTTSVQQPHDYAPDPFRRHGEQQRVPKGPG